MTTSSEVPGRFPIAIDGHAYSIDPSKYQRESLPVMRQQSDQSNEPGEQSLSPRGLWRRSQDSWHHGAGQDFLDGKVGGTVADPERFNLSAGADAWSRGQVSLLPAVTKLRDGGQGVVAAGTHAYCYDGSQVYWFANPTSTADSWSSAVIHAGQAAQAVRSIATNGHYIWAALGSSGLHRTVRGATTSTADVPSQACTLVGWALGRLLIANNHELWEVTDPLGAPAISLLRSHPDTDFKWRFIREGRSVIFAGGNIDTGAAWNLNTDVVVGGNGEIYKITLTPTDTALAPPSMATYLPDGEQVYDCRFYAGGVIIATSKGVRVGVADAQGNIDYGPLFGVEGVLSGYPVHALEPQDRYVWFSWHQGVAYGLARADLGYFTDTLTPAWAPDVTSNIGVFTPLVDSAASLANGKLMFSMYDLLDSTDITTGVYLRNTSTGPLALVATLDTGQIGYSTTETKRLVSLELRHKALPAGASIEVKMSIDGGAFTSIGTSSGTGVTGTVFNLGPVTAESVEFRFTLNRGSTNTTGPTLLRYTLRALPVPTRNETFLLPIIMTSVVETLAGDGQPHVQDVTAEMAFLKGLERAGTVVDFQVGAETLEGYVEETQFVGERWSDTPNRDVEGVLMVKMATLS